MKLLFALLLFSLQQPLLNAYIDNFIEYDPYYDSMIEDRPYLDSPRYEERRYDTLGPIKVDYATGELTLTYFDTYRAKSHTLPNIPLRRKYNSSSSYEGTTLGRGWSLAFDSRILEQTGDSLLVFDAELGKTVTYKKSDAGIWKYDGMLLRKEIRKEGDAYVLQRIGCDTRSVFEADGRLKYLKYKKQTMTIHHDEDGNIVRVDNNHGKSIYFHYETKRLYISAYKHFPHDIMGDGPVIYDFSTTLAAPGRIYLQLSDTTDDEYREFHYKYNSQAGLSEIADSSNSKAIHYNQRRVGSVILEHFGTKIYLYKEHANTTHVEILHKERGQITSEQHVYFTFHPGTPRLSKVVYALDEGDPTDIESRTYSLKGYPTGYTRKRAGELLERRQITYGVHNKVTHYQNYAYGYESERRFTYNDKGNLTSISNEAGQKTILHYNDQEQIIRMTHPDYTVHYEYDPVNQKPIVIRINGMGYMKVTYDALGEIVSVKAMGEDDKELTSSSKLAMKVSTAMSNLLADTKGMFKDRPRFMQCY
jgi:YD repeat-containing protein